MASGSSNRRRSRASIFRRTTSFTPLDGGEGGPQSHSDFQPKKRSGFTSPWTSTPNLLGRKTSRDTDSGTEALTRDEQRNADNGKHSESSSESPSQRPSLVRKSGRPPSVFGSFRSKNPTDEDTPPTTATSASSRTPSFGWQDFPSDGDSGTPADFGRNKTVLHHGDVQTNSGLFWRKKEYLVLTETHLVRFKSRSKAVEVFRSINETYSRPGHPRHSSSPSIDSAYDSHSLHSDASSEAAAIIPLEQVVGVFLVEEAKNVFAVELSWLEYESGQGSSIILQFSNPAERDLWLKAVRLAGNKARLSDTNPISIRLAEWAAKVCEHERDYDPENFALFKVIKRNLGSKPSLRAGPDDTLKSSAIVCFLVIGMHKVHLVHLPKHSVRSAYSNPNDISDFGSFGIMNLTWISLSSIDDTFSLAFRFPFQKTKSYQLASLASPEIALRLRARDSALRPEWVRQPFAFQVPSKIEELYVPPQYPTNEDHNCFDRTLIAFCVSYHVNPSSIRYTIDYDVEDAPRFQLLEPNKARAGPYSVYELLAVMRALRFNESFSSISFAGVNFDALHGLYDSYGSEYLCTGTKAGTPTHLKLEEQADASVLVQEIRALAMGNKRLRRLDFSYSISATHVLRQQRKAAPPDTCAVTEALGPLCKDQVTNVDWIGLNGLDIRESDLDYLVTMAADRSCHIRAVEMSNCGLTDRGMTVMLDALRSQSQTLEAIDFSRNAVRIEPYDLSRQLDAFSLIRRLDLSKVSVAMSADALLSFDTIARWRLEDLRLRSIRLNAESVSALCRYLAHPNSAVLRDLVLSDCGLNGDDAARIMKSMTTEPGAARMLHLDLSENLVHEYHGSMIAAIGKNLAPTHLTLRSIEYEKEDSLQELFLALAANRSIRYLDIAKMSLPFEAGESTCRAIEKLFAHNCALEELDISGEESRLESSKLGVGIHQSLQGLKSNQSLVTLRLQNQKLGLRGASSLADVLKENHTLKYLYCDRNGITLSGFTDLVNSLATNTTVLYMPSLEDGRDDALRQTESQIKMAQKNIDSAVVAANMQQTSATSKMSSMRRTFQNISSGMNLRGSGHHHSSSVSKTAAVPRWTEQDVQAALRLVSDGWEDQAKRLQKFLERNWAIANGIVPTDESRMNGANGGGHGDDETAQRPATASSISKVLEKVRYDRTPTIEKNVELGVEAGHSIAGTPQQTGERGRALSRSAEPSAPLAPPSDSNTDDSSDESSDEDEQPPPPPAKDPPRRASTSARHSPRTAKHAAASFNPLNLDIDSTPIFEKDAVLFNEQEMDSDELTAHKHSTSPQRSRSEAARAVAAVPELGKESQMQLRLPHKRKDAKAKAQQQNAIV